MAGDLIREVKRLQQNQVRNLRDANPVVHDQVAVRIEKIFMLGRRVIRRVENQE